MPSSSPSTWRKQVPWAGNNFDALGGARSRGADRRRGVAHARESVQCSPLPGALPRPGGADADRRLGAALRLAAGDAEDHLRRILHGGAGRHRCRVPLRGEPLGGGELFPVRRAAAGDPRRGDRAAHHHLGEEPDRGAGRLRDHRGAVPDHLEHHARPAQRQPGAARSFPHEQGEPLADADAASDPVGCAVFLRRPAHLLRPRADRRGGRGVRRGHRRHLGRPRLPDPPGRLLDQHPAPVRRALPHHRHRRGAVPADGVSLQARARQLARVGSEAGSLMLIRNAAAIMTGLAGAGARAAGPDLRFNSHIEEIGRLAPRSGERVVDATDCVVYPGWVNTHHHLAQSVLKGVPQGINLPLLSWLESVPYRYRARFDAGLLELAAEIGMTELMLSGCTTLADHHYVYWKGIDYDPAKILFDLAARFGLRFVLCRGGATSRRPTLRSPRPSIRLFKMSNAWCRNITTAVRNPCAAWCSRRRRRTSPCGPRSSSRWRGRRAGSASGCTRISRRRRTTSCSAARSSAARRSSSSPTTTGSARMSGSRTWCTPPSPRSA